MLNVSPLCHTSAKDSQLKHDTIFQPGHSVDRGVPALHHDLRHLLHHRDGVCHQRAPPLLGHLPPHGPLGEDPLPAEAPQDAVHAGPHRQVSEHRVI